ncbi:hypothetical protein AB7008_30225 [Bradyrhizobium sp. 521_C7_N1_3]|uniref:hypothetical protein n=1 Tax=Bradyrhizobium sp. 521_C7_N1_3 TaxID=3240368 RepID=UPI003F8C6BF3
MADEVLIALAGSNQIAAGDRQTINMCNTGRSDAHMSIEWPVRHVSGGWLDGDRTQLPT